MVELEPESPTLLSEMEVTDLCHAIHQMQEKMETELMEKMGIQLVRMESCTRSLKQVVVSHAQALRKNRQECEKWKRMTEEVSNKLRKVQDKLIQEKQERSEEKEWLLSVWPDGFVLPTILRQFEIPQKTTTFVKDVQDESEKKRIQALINRRTSRNEVLHHMEIATHWKIVSEPDPTANGALTTFYHNTKTGESVLDAPTAMFYKPPLEWDENKMDWKDSYGIEHFYPKDPNEVEKENKEKKKGEQETKEKNSLIDEDDHEEEDEDESTEGNDTLRGTNNSSKTIKANEDEDEEEEEEEIVDPSVFRELLTKEIAHTKELEAQLEKSKSQQRSFALQLLNATRDTFEKEKEQLAEEDEAKKAVERKRRKQKQEEKLSAEATTAALLKKQQSHTSGRIGTNSINNATQRSLNLDSVGKKNLLLTKEEELFEAEIEEFVLQQRADRFYLAAPMSKNPQVRMHQTYDDEYVHMKYIETLTAQTERMEFDLIEKTTSHQEDAQKKVSDLKKKQVEIHETLLMMDEERWNLVEQIPILQIPTPKPTILTNAAERIQSAPAAFSVHYDEDADTKAMAATAAEEGTRATSMAALAMDGERLEEEQAWERWDLKETKRLELFERTQERMSGLETIAKRFHLELALIESEIVFFDQLTTCEKETNTKLFDLQATSQVERARFYMERIAREENLLFLKQQLEENCIAMEKAFHLPRQALNPLEKIELEAQKEIEMKNLEIEKENFEKKIEKEKKAQKQLIQLEKRFYLYILSKLQEENQLMNEKQVLWELNMEMTTKMDDTRNRIEQLYQETWKQQVEMDKQENEENEEHQKREGQYQYEKISSPFTSARLTHRSKWSVEMILLEKAKGFFEVQLSHIQDIRRFLFICYERERRWREIASTALIEVTSTDQWMTEQQQERYAFQLNQLKKEISIQKQKQTSQQIKFKNKIEFLKKQLKEAGEAKSKSDFKYQQTHEFLRKQSQFLLETVRQQMNLIIKQKQQEIDQLQVLVNNLQQEKKFLRHQTNEQIENLEKDKELQHFFVDSLRKEMALQTLLNQQLLQSLNAMQKQKAMETNDLKFRVHTQIKKIQSLELWIQSLKMQAKEKHHEMILFQKKMEEQIQKQKFQQKQMRLQNWKQRITIQGILTDTNNLFDFFCDGLSILCGANQKENEKFRQNGGIDVLAILCQYSARPEIKQLAAKALGKVAWNANVSLRSMGWKAKRKWFEWVDKMSRQIVENKFQDVQTFDQHLTMTATSIDSVKEVLDPSDNSPLPIDENNSELANVYLIQKNKTYEQEEKDDERKTYLADISRLGGAFLGEFDQDELTKIKQDKMLLRNMMQKTWKHFSTIEKPNGNEANQEYIGLASGVMKALLELCRHGGKISGQHPIEIIRASKQDTSLTIQRNALLSLAIIVMNTRNTTIIGKMEGSIELLVGFLKPLPFTSSSIAPARAAMAREDLEIVRYAIHALANLAHQNPWNQQKIAHYQAIPWLLELITTQKDSDLIYAATLALSHLSHANTTICEEIYDMKGIEILVDICDSYRIFDIIELDQFEMIQKNTAETLANVIVNLEEKREKDIVTLMLEMHRVNLQEKKNLIGFKDGSSGNKSVIAPFVLMCASSNRDVMFYGALILGSLAQNDEMRSLIGNAGGIDALFLLAGLQGEEELQSQATWALANLTWNRENQYRIARYMHQLYQLCILPDHPSVASSTINKVRVEIRDHALCILANSMFYNGANRLLVVHDEKIMDLLKENCLHGVKQSNSVLGAVTASLEHSARALCALSYHDEIALEMGARGYLQVFLTLCTCEKSHLVQKNGLYGIINLCLHDINKTRMIEVQEGVKILVKLSGGDNQEIRAGAIEALDLLADIRQMKQDGSINALLLASAKNDGNGGEHADTKKLLSLCDSRNMSVVAMALDAISDEVWKKPSAKVKVRNERGLEKLLQICIQYSTQASTIKSSSQMEADAQKKVILGSLWAIRNSVSDNSRNQDFFGAYQGVKYLIQVHDQHRQDDDIIEAVLAALIAVCKNNPRNSQELLQIGLDVLITIAEGNKHSSEEERREKLTRRKSVMAARPPSQAPHEGLENSTLAAELLHLIAPHNTPVEATAGGNKSPIHSSPSNSPDKRKISIAAANSPKRNRQGLPSPVHHA